MAESAKQRKLGIIAGGGDLPLKLAQACRDSQRPFHVIALDGWVDDEVADFEHTRLGLGQVGGIFKVLGAEGCEDVTIAGYVKRPDFSSLKLDLTGTRLLPKVVAAARKGDDALLKVLVAAVEKQGFRVIGADEIRNDLVAGQGVYGVHQPSEDDLRDVAKAVDLVHDLGPYDVGQGAVICRGLVLAIEAAEGTDAMLARCQKLPEEIKGQVEDRKGVLVKVPKRGQETRVDLPTIGVRTIEGAALAGLSGVAIAAGKALIIDEEVVVAAADQAGLFLMGIELDEYYGVQEE